MVKEITLEELLNIAVKHNASDLHLVTGLAPILRIDGIINDINIVLSRNFNEDYTFSTQADKDNKYQKVDKKSLEKIIANILNDEQKQKFEENKDLDFSISTEGGRFRVNLSKEKDNPKLVARVISNETPSLEDINMPEITKDILKHKQGLVLVTGPTGCGKSTTLAAMVDYINKNRRANIVTLEDPIEFIFKPHKSVITQRELKTDMTSFEAGLKHVLRQDPDVIMVGEMRDLETIAAAITLAETGHLIIATLHTYSAVQTIDRIIDIFPPHQQAQIKAQLSMILSSVISQKLLPKVGGGRVAAREVLIRNNAVSNLIRDNKIRQIKNVIETSSGEGMISFGRAIKDLYHRDLISEEVAQSQMDDPAVFI
ncbi:MAG: type IV pilus twitching motility protein PilT [Parcubacteria group bacterium]